MSVSNIRQVILEKMEEENLSVWDIAKKSHVKKNTIYNIVAGLSKNPGIEAVAAIASALNCSIDELFGNDINFSQQKSIKKEKTYEFSVSLFNDVVDCVNKKIANRHTDISFNEVMEIIKEGYIFSLQKNSNQLSISFIEWLVENRVKKFEVC